MVVRLSSLWLDKANRPSPMAKDDMNEFWADVARGRWQVQDFQISPDTLAASATSWCGFHRKFLKAHHAGLNMSGTFQLFLGDVGAGWVGEYRGPYRYVGRGQHRDCCLSELELYRLKLHGCDQDPADSPLPRRLNICMKLSTVSDQDQQADAGHLQKWSQIASVRSQFPRFLHFAHWKTVAGKDRSVLLVEAMGDGTSVGREMKKIADDVARISSREIFVLVFRYMMWGFTLQRQYILEEQCFLQDMHMNNCVFMHGVPKGQNPAPYAGKGSRFSVFRFIDCNGWWEIGRYPWKDVDKLFGCIYDVVNTQEFQSCRALYPMHHQCVANVTLVFFMTIFLYFIFLFLTFFW